MLQCASELTVVGWLSGQCVTLGCPGAQNREVSCSEEASNRQPGQNTGNAYFASTTALSLLSIELVKHLFTFLNAFLALLSCSPFFLSLLPLVEDWMGGGGLLAFLHRVLCARPGLGSCPYPLSPLSPFSDSLPSSSPLNNPLQPLQLPVIAFLTTAFASNSALFNPPPAISSYHLPESILM